MEVHFTPELESRLTHSAAQQEEAHFVEAVKHGEAALQQGEYLTHEQAG